MQKLQLATDQAKLEMEKCLADRAEAEQKIKLVKGLLMELDEDAKERIQIKDTRLPELLALHQAAQDAHETAEKRYETNNKYLELYKQKL